MLVGNSNFKSTRYNEIDQVIATSTLTEDEKCAAIASIVELRPTDVNKVYYAGNTAMHLTAKYALAEVTKLLINLGFPINAQNSRGLTPLHCAAETNTPVVLLILCHQLKIEINTVDSKNESALHKAARAKSAECIKILVSQSTLNLTIRNQDGQTAQDIVEMDHDAARKSNLLTALKALPLSNGLMPEVEQLIFENLVIAMDESGLKDLRKKFSELNLHSGPARVSLHALSIADDNLRPNTSPIAEVKNVARAKIRIPEDMDFLLGNSDKIDTFLNEGGDPNHVILPHQLPLLYYAFIYKKKELFIRLILAGASLSIDKLSQHFYKIISSDQEGSHAEFLLAVIKDLHPIVANEHAIFEGDLQKLTDSIHKALLAGRFMKQFSVFETVGFSEFLTNPCMKAIHFICGGIMQGSVRIFDSVYVSKCTIGLLDQFPPETILEEMLKLTPKLNNVQKQICFYILKEMLIYNIDFGYEFNHEFKGKIVAYLKDNAEKDLQEAMLRLFEYLEAFKKHSLFKRYLELQRMISFYPFKKLDGDHVQLSLFNNAEDYELSVYNFSLDIRNITLQLFQLGALKEFRENVWEPDSTDRALNSPTIITHEKALEKVRNYITAQISAQNSAENRAKAFTYFLHVARKCLVSSNDCYLDFNAIMTIIGGINNCSREYLKEILAIIDKKTQKLYRQISDLYHPRDNFKYARQFMCSQSLLAPFLPVFFKDKVMLKTHGNVANISMMGENYLPLLLLKRKIRLLSGVFDNRLLFQANVIIDECIFRSEALALKSKSTMKLKVKSQNRITSSCIVEQENRVVDSNQSQKLITPIFAIKKENSSASEQSRSTEAEQKQKHKVKRNSGLRD